MSTKKRKARDTQDEDEAFILGRFLEFAEGRGVDEFAKFLLHCGVDRTDIDLAGGEIPRAILEHLQTTRWRL